MMIEDLYANLESETYILMDERDLRLALSRGYLAPSRFYTKDEVHGVGKSLWEIYSTGDVASVRTDSKPCCVTVDAPYPLSNEMLNKKVLPASSFKQVLFQTDEELKTFKRRNAAFRGLATGHIDLKSDPNLQIETSTDIKPASIRPSKQAIQSAEIQNRTIGAVAAILSANQAPLSVLDLVAESKFCDKDLVVSILTDLAGTANKATAKPLANAALSVLALPELKDGADPTELLQKLSTKFLEELGNNAVQERIAEWSDYGIKVLQNEVEASSKLMEDEGDGILLKASLLLARTAPLSTQSLKSNWGEHLANTGPRILSAALTLTGWHQGFAKQNAPKESLGLYSYCAQHLASNLGKSKRSVPKTEKRVSTSTDGDCVTHSLIECKSKAAVCSAVVYANPNLMEAWWATRRVIDSMNEVDGKKITAELHAEKEAFVLRDGQYEMTAHAHSPDLIRWSMTWSQVPESRQRRWKPNEYERVANVAKNASCCVYTMKYPFCGLHVDQRLSTMDHEEIRFQLLSLMNGADQLQIALDSPET